MPKDRSEETSEADDSVPESSQEATQTVEDSSDDDVTDSEGGSDGDGSEVSEEETKRSAPTKKDKPERNGAPKPLA